MHVSPVNDGLRGIQTRFAWAEHNLGELRLIPAAAIRVS